MIVEIKKKLYKIIIEKYNYNNNEILEKRKSKIIAANIQEIRVMQMYFLAVH